MKGHDYKDGASTKKMNWIARARMPPFRSKRAEELAQLLGVRLALAGIKKDSAGVEALLAATQGPRVLATLPRRIKAELEVRLQRHISRLYVWNGTNKFAGCETRGRARLQEHYLLPCQPVEGTGLPGGAEEQVIVCSDEAARFAVALSREVSVRGPGPTSRRHRRQLCRLRLSAAPRKSIPG